VRLLIKIFVSFVESRDALSKGNWDFWIFLSWVVGPAIIDAIEPNLVVSWETETR
jgi:hypothetical protein